MTFSPLLLPFSCLCVSLHFPGGRVKLISLEARNLTPAPLKKTHPEPDFMAFEMMRDKVTVKEGGVRLRWWKKEHYPQSCLLTFHRDCFSLVGKGTTLHSPTSPPPHLPAWCIWRTEEPLMLFTVSQSIYL